MWTSLGALGVLLAAKMIPKMGAVHPLVRRTMTGPGEAWFGTLLMSTGLTFGTISSLYGLNAGIIDRTQFSLLLTVVVGSAVIPTVIAQRWFTPWWSAGRLGTSLAPGTRGSHRPSSPEEVVMGFYAEQVLPRIVNAACGMRSAEPQRRRVCQGLHGRVVEIGFGSGLNVPFYPTAVSGVSAVEPAGLGWRLAAKRLAASSVPVHRAGLDGQSLPFADDSYDTALSTWTLCTIPDAGAALRELRRVLKPGGTLHFVEHGLAPDEGVRRWQHRLEPVQKRVFGGCHLTRPVADLLIGAGFTIVEVEVFYEEGTPRPIGANSLGIAQAPER